MRGRRAPAPRRLLDTTYSLTLSLVIRRILSSLPCTVVSSATLEHGDKRGYLLSFRLPPRLPPSFRGMAVKVAYHVVVEGTVASKADATSSAPKSSGGITAVGAEVQGPCWGTSRP